MQKTGRLDELELCKERSVEKQITRRKHHPWTLKEDLFWATCPENLATEKLWPSIVMQSLSPWERVLIERLYRRKLP